MNAFLSASSYFGILLSLIAYIFAVWIKKKFGYAFLNPLLVAIIITVAAVLLLNVDYEVYNSSAKYLSFLLTPATVCLAVPLYEQFDKLKENAAAILIGIFSGVLTSIASIFAMSKLFGLSRSEFVTFLPKSITTAIDHGGGDHRDRRSGQHHLRRDTEALQDRRSDRQRSSHRYLEPCDRYIEGHRDRRSGRSDLFPVDRGRRDHDGPSFQPLCRTVLILNTSFRYEGNDKKTRLSDGS